MKTIEILSAGGSGGGAVCTIYHVEDYLRRLGLDIFDLVPVTRFSKDRRLEMLEKLGSHLIKKWRAIPKSSLWASD